MEKFQKAFQSHLHIDSYYLIHKRMSLLAGIQPQLIDICRASCIAYTGEYEALTTCPHCRHARYQDSGKPYSIFEYLPIIPRLQAFFKSPKMVEELLYRKQYLHEPGSFADIFDGSYYCDLLNTRISVDGHVFDENLFQNPYDIALGLLSNGFQVFKKVKGGSATAWPFILRIYNFRPEVCHSWKYLMPISVVPGPHSPKDHNSFLYPL